MRLLMSVIISLLVSVIFFLIAKKWGQSQQYIDYNHPFYAQSGLQPKEPLLFIKSRPENLLKNLNSDQNLYLDIAITKDQKIIIVNDADYTPTSKYTHKMLSEIGDRGLLISEYIPLLKNKKIILNIIENPAAGPDIVVYELEKMKMSSGDNFIIISPYEAQMKNLKERAPTYLFGSTAPEILRIKALESVFLIEAATFRADIIIHPLKFYGKTFFTETLQTDMARRFKRIIVGPLDVSEKSSALELKPFGIILND